MVGSVRCKETEWQWWPQSGRQGLSDELTLQWRLHGARAEAMESGQRGPGTGPMLGTVGHRGGWSTVVQVEYGGGDLAVGSRGQAPAQREGEPPEGSGQKRASSPGSLPGPPWLPSRGWTGVRRAEKQKPGLAASRPLQAGRLWQELGAGSSGRWGSASGCKF